MNPISPELVTGTTGELLVQLRLLQYGIQAAPPLKDSGNDLIAVKHIVMRSIQIKTSTVESYSAQNLPLLYHILAAVELSGEGNQLFLDESRVFLIPFQDVPQAPRKFSLLEKYLLTEAWALELFTPHSR